MPCNAVGARCCDRCGQHCLQQLPLRAAGHGRPQRRGAHAAAGWRCCRRPLDLASRLLPFRLTPRWAAVKKERGKKNQSLLILLSVRRFRAIAGGKKIYQQRVPNELPGDMPKKMSGYMLNKRYARKMLGNILRKMLRGYVGKKIRMSKKCHNICQKETHKACPKIGGKICQKICQERVPGNMPERTSKRYVTKCQKNVTRNVKMSRHTSQKLGKITRMCKAECQKKVWPARMFSVYCLYAWRSFRILGVGVPRSTVERVNS